MQRDDAEMTPPRPEPSRTVPTSPVLPTVSTDHLTTSRRISMPPIPPTSPPLLPLFASPTTPPASPNDEAPPPHHHLLSSFVGTLEPLLRSALRHTKWALILVLPNNNRSFSSPSSPTTTARPAWGPRAYHQQNKLYAPQEVADTIMLWRRTTGSSDAERYQAFFPVDGHPHLALLDPRSGERLAVWGNVDGQNMMSHNAISHNLWNVVLDDLKTFLKTHSLDDDALGPAHFREKSWAVRTRRIAQGPSSPSLQPTSVMDDEDTAIAAAIAASLAETERTTPEDDQDASSWEYGYPEDGYPEDDDSSGDMYSNYGMTQDGDGSAEQGSTEGDENVTLSERSSELGSATMDISTSTAGLRRTASMPVPIPPRGREPTPSSVESLSLSYIERMDSCLRSSTDPALLEARRLRQEQDEDLARSLQEDRKRIREEELEVAKRAAEKAQKLAAEARLPDEPGEGAEGVFTIALRLPGGLRITRRFNSFDKLISVADFAIANIGCVQITRRTPTTVLRIPGFKIQPSSWGTQLKEMSLSSRTMFILNTE